MAVANGSGFTATSVVLFNQTSLTPQVQTSGILTVTIPAEQLLKPGAASIAVQDTRTGVTSNTLTYAVLSPAAKDAAVLQMVSMGIDGLPANADSLVKPSISATGRFVAFQSAGTNLVQQQVLAPWQNIFLRDTCLGAEASCAPGLRLISISSDGTSGGNFHSRVSSVSQDGRYVAFDSGATNLVATTPSYCNQTTNCVYLRDTCIGAPAGCLPATSLVSIAPGEAGAVGSNPVLSPSGRYLTFLSKDASSAQVQTYLRDLCVGATGACVPRTLLVSTNSRNDVANEGTGESAVSPDGRFVGFVSSSTNLIDPTQPAVQSTAKMFLKDMCLGASAPCTPAVTQIDTPESGVANSELDYEATPSLSATGRYVAYASRATNLVSQDVRGFINVYRRDTCFGATKCTIRNELISLGNDGATGNSGSHQQSMSADGRFVAFTSIATNLVWGLPFAAGSWQDVYVRDTCLGATGTCYPSTVRVAVTKTIALQVSSDAGASLPSISADGHYVAFLTSSTNLTSGGGGGHTQVYLSRTGF